MRVQRASRPDDQCAACSPPPPPPPPPLHPAPAAAAVGQQQPAPSVLRGCLVRLKYAGAYCLLPVEGLAAAARQGGAPLLSVQAPAGQQSSSPLSVKLTATSGSNPLTDDQWEASGRAEAARFDEHLWQRGQPLSLAEVGGSTCVALFPHACRGSYSAQTRMTARCTCLTACFETAFLNRNTNLARHACRLPASPGASRPRWPGTSSMVQRLRTSSSGTCPCCCSSCRTQQA